MPSTPVRMSGPALLTNAAATKYTVPANTKSVVRNIHVSNPNVAAQTFTLSIGADAAGTRLYDSYPIPAGSVLDVWVMWVLSAGEIVQAFCPSTTNVMTFTMDGDERTL